MIRKIEALITDLKWEIKDRKVNYMPASDLENIVRELEAIVSSEREYYESEVIKAAALIDS